MKNVCSKECMHYHNVYRPYRSTSCSRVHNWHRDTVDGKVCKYFVEKGRITGVFKMRSKTEVTKKYIELLKKKDITTEEQAQIEILEWVLKIEEMYKAKGK